jgi:NAD(P)-dependent dehydrogenase (short-subunit alcohol dehydrogenase family)
MDLQLKDLRVFVTAGASGIGLAIVESFLAEGAKIAMCDIDAQSVKKLSEKYPDIQTYICDVSDSTAIQQVIRQATEKMGGLDCLVNNAGIAGPTAKIEDIDDTAWQQCLDICLNGQFCGKAIIHLLSIYLLQQVNLALHYARPMQQQNGALSALQNHSLLNWVKIIFG